MWLGFRFQGSGTLVRQLKSYAMLLRGVWDACVVLYLCEC